MSCAWLAGPNPDNDGIAVAANQIAPGKNTNLCVPPPLCQRTLMELRQQQRPQQRALQGYRRYLSAWRASRTP
ncbi:hypothetical protein GCM10007350_27350 [Jeongeupia chitinilytica]|uniref:Uncharacterized protein n=1 Tax=Jeongeupia chitinilytica TaxID=1041641 RepID=A0ABQ3H3A0_9NEIS|nr:hypothetical protein GCM10007350_27350 [Jeongeupia chitinilytica]